MADSYRGVLFIIVITFFLEDGGKSWQSIRFISFDIQYSEEKQDGEWSSDLGTRSSNPMANFYSNRLIREWVTPGNPGDPN